MDRDKIILLYPVALFMKVGEWSDPYITRRLGSHQWYIYLFRLLANKEYTKINVHWLSQNKLSRNTDEYESLCGYMPSG